MRWMLIIAIFVAVPIIIGMYAMKRPGRQPQAEPIDAAHEPDLPDAETTRHMSDPPPGSRGAREQDGMP
ncbi:MAG: hypothetical protein ACXIVQ_11150 [Acidimicrobiales bacterium]